MAISKFLIFMRLAASLSDFPVAWPGAVRPGLDFFFNKSKFLKLLCSFTRKTAEARVHTDERRLTSYG
jgi:hypothetical protein